MRCPILLLAVFSVCLAHAQKMADPRPFANSISEEGLKKHLYIVASKDFEGRETATEGQRKAAAYIESNFKSLGLRPGNNGDFQMYYPLFQDSLAGAAIRINNQAFQINEDFAVNPGANHSSTLFGSEVVFAGYGISDSLRDDYKGLDAKGKIVLLLNGEPEGYKPTQVGRRNNQTKQQAALKNGAIAVLIIQSKFTGNADNNKGTMYLSAYKKSILPNTFYVSEKITEAIMGADYEGAKAGNPQAEDPGDRRVA